MYLWKTTKVAYTCLIIKGKKETYHTVGTIQTLNTKIVDRGTIDTQIHERSFPGLAQALQ